MPRIDAPTVAEHREQRRRQVVQNAAELLRRSGAAGVTPAAVASASGLARTSVYQYFPSSAELVAAAVEELFVAAADDLTHVVASAGPDRRAQLAAYARGMVEAAGSGHHPALLELAGELPALCRARLRELHGRLTDPLVSVLRGWPVDEPELTAHFVLGVVNQATMLVAAGADLDDTLEGAVRFVEAAVDAPGRPS